MVEFQDGTETLAGLPWPTSTPTWIQYFCFLACQHASENRFRVLSLSLTLYLWVLFSYMTLFSFTLSTSSLRCRFSFPFFRAAQLLLLASSFQLSALYLRPHFINLSLISLFALLPPSPSLPPLNAVALSFPRSPVYILQRLNSLLIA